MRGTKKVEKFIFERLKDNLNNFICEMKKKVYKINHFHELQILACDISHHGVTQCRSASGISETSHIRHVKGPAGEGWPHCDHSPSSLICCHYLYEHFKIKNKQRGRTAMWQSGIEGFDGKVRERGRDILDTLCFIMSFIIPVSDEQHALSYPACSPHLSSCATPTVCTWIQILYF